MCPGSVPTVSERASRPGSPSSDVGRPVISCTGGAGNVPSDSRESVGTVRLGVDASAGGKER